ncbi:MAG: patatin-like phospholipase family protein [Mycobacterium sp.]|nr:patatin-like phospholipase family protein [Mycobacterium sp.]
MDHSPQDTGPAPHKTVDLVLSGGGVKGIGLVGAVGALGDAGYHVGRVSGTSAGSLVGAVIAAANRGQPAAAQLSGDQLRDLAMSLPFPMYSLDRTDGKVPRWPSFGITVTAQRAAEGDGPPGPGLAPLINLPGTPRLLENLINTALLGHDQTYLRQPSVAARTIVVDAAGIGYLNFDISQADRKKLYDNGYTAAREFLNT